MSPRLLLAGQNWVQSRFYSCRSTWRRIGRAFSYLAPAVVLHGLVPLNLGYRARHRAFGTFEAGRRYGELASGSLSARGA